MKIRSISYFLDPDYPFNNSKIEEAGRFLRAAKPAFETAGYEVQTARLVTIPFPKLFKGLEKQEIIKAAQDLETLAAKQGFAYLALGPALIEEPESYKIIPDLIAATENTFTCAEIATPEFGVSLPALRACAEIIHQLAPQDPNGFANLYFTAIANVPAGSPFFPASYHIGTDPKFAIATEAASLAVDAFTEASSLNEGIQNLIKSINIHAEKLNQVGVKLAQEFSIPFGGIDFSLAPFPDEANSLGTALERIGVPAAGLHGSLAAAAILADTLDKATFPRVGFSGLLFPQLEDSTLALRAEEGHLTVKDLLMYSAVCGTGLDTIPLPGDTPPEMMVPLLLDLAALSQRLEKPLTARLMPIPGKIAGEKTNFDFPFFANSKVMALQAKPLQGHLTGDERFKLKARK